MRFLSWLRDRTPGFADSRAIRSPRPTSRRRAAASPLQPEQLEARWCPAGYTITDLGSFGGTNGGAGSDARAINNAGQVAGVAYTASGAPHAFLFSGGVKIDLGTLPGFA